MKCAKYARKERKIYRHWEYGVLRDGENKGTCTRCWKAVEGRARHNFIENSSGRGKKDESESDLLLDRNSPLGVELQLQPSVSVLDTAQVLYNT